MKLTAFHRGNIKGQIQSIFKPFEQFLNPGDEFDYAKLNIASCHLQGTLEGVVWLPLTEDSPTFQTVLGIEQGDEWPGEIPFAGFYAISPNECFRAIEPETPYLVYVTGWESGEVRDVSGNVVRDAQVFVQRPITEPNYVYLSGNTVYHMGCVKITMNQA